jgi:two-component system CheB/CheR fusion protein
MKTSSRDLVAVIHALAQVRTLDEIMEIVRHAARDLSGADGATFVLKEDGFCYYADEDAIGPLWKGKRFPLSSCISGWSMLHKQPVAIPDIYQDPRIPIDAYRPTFVKSLVMVPIHQKAPIGAIGTYWASERQASPEQISLLQALADTTAVAIENVNLLNSLNKQIADLAEANQAKDRFLMMVSHELRTPLNSIEGWAELLCGDNLSAEESEQGLKTILRNAKSQKRIIEDLMDTSTIIMNRITFEKKPVDVISILENSVHTIRFNSASKHLQIEFDNQFENAWIIGDPERLNQAFTNILANAAKFTPENGKISVRAEPEGPAIRISVTDNGEGIPSEFLPFVFDRFRQADGSLTRKHGGLGLGLAIVQHIVQAFNGEIEAHSAGPGQGSTFTLRFPLYHHPLISGNLAADWAHAQ